MDDSPCRVTYLIDGLNVGGAQVGMARLLGELDPTTFDVTVVGLDGKGGDVVFLLPDHVDVIDLGLGQRYRLDRLSPLWQELGRTDILVTSLFHSTVLGTLLGRIRRVPTILCWQHSAAHVTPLRRKLSTLAFERCDHVLADSKAVAGMLADNGVPSSDVSTVPIAGIDVDTFSPTAGGTFDGDRIHVGSIGQHVPAKNYDGLIDCAARLGDRFQFHVVGDGPDRDELERLAEERASGHVTFHGEIPPDEVPDFLNRLDIYLQPSRREGLCITVIEAMACGLPVVGSEVGGISESVEHERTGLLAPPQDIETHCEHLRTLADDELLRRRYGRAGRERVVEHYSADALKIGFLDAVAAIHDATVNL